MQQKLVVESPNDLKPEVAELDADTAAPATMILPGWREPQPVPFPLRQPERVYSAGYRHWGINE